jgi:4-hydroxybenzoate polyprenyltransferase
LAWSLSIFVVPFFDARLGLGAGSPAFWMLAIGFFIYYFLNTVFCDLRDIEGDRAAGVVTLANSLGIAGCYRWIAALSLAWCGILVAMAVFTPWLDLFHAVFLISAALAYPLGIILMRETIRKSEWIINVSIELGVAVYALGILALAWHGR